jgi:subtilisin family serine protease
MKQINTAKISSAIISALTLAAFLAACNSTPATPKAAGTNLNGQPANSGELLVKYRKGSPQNLQPGSLSISSLGDEDWGTLALVSVPEGRELEYAAKYEGQSGIEYVEPNYSIANPGRKEGQLGTRALRPSGLGTKAITPIPASSITDPYFVNVPASHGFDTTGVDGTVYKNQPYLWGIQRVRAPETWAAGFKGTGVVIADIDEGVDMTHPDLAANIWNNPNPSSKCPGAHGYDFVDDDNDPTDTGGHGTHTAGTIAAAINGKGVVGVAPEAKLMVLRGLGYQGGSTFMLVRAMKYAADCGAQIASNSWGGAGRTKAFSDIMEYGNARGTTYVFSAGNSWDAGNPQNSPVGYSQFLSGVIGVAATSADNYQTGFSSAGKFVTVAAPGQGIMSTVPVAQGNTPDDAYLMISGTSMACPHVSGVAALVVQAYRSTHNGKNPSPALVRILIEQGANPTLTAQTSAPDWTEGGQFGYGLVDAKYSTDLALIAP